MTRITKLFLSISLFSLLANCAVARVTDPKPSEQGKSGVVLFKYYHYWLEDNWFFYSKATNLDTDLILSEVEAIEESGKKMKLKALPIDFKKIEESEGEKSTNFFNYRAYSALYIPDTSKKYVITNVKYCQRYLIFLQHIFTSNCFDYPLNEAESFAILPLETKPDTIRYLGFFKFEEVETKENDPYNGTNFRRVAIFIPFERKVKIKMTLQKDDGNYAKESPYSYKNYYFPDMKEDTIQGQEETAIKQFILIQKYGYWKEKADKKIYNSP